MNAVFTYFYQTDMQVIYDEQVYYWYFPFSFIGDALLNIASVMAFFHYRKSFPLFVRRVYLGILGLVIVTSFINVPDLDVLFRPGVFFSIKGMGTWINLGIMFAAADRERTGRLLKLFYYLCCFFVVAALVKLISIGTIGDRDISMYAILEFTVDLVWVFPFFFLRRDDYGWGKGYQFTVMILILLFALAIGARSYTLTLLCLIMLKAKDTLKISKGTGLLIFLLAVGLIATGYFLLVNSELYNTYQNIVDIFLKRGTEDTRTGQIVEFLKQYDTQYLFSGLGPMATWDWENQAYASLDNQMLLTAWWAGLPAAVLYLVYLCKAFFRKIAHPDEETRAAQIIVGFWILGCFGLAIYATMSCSVYYFFISLLIGIIYRNNEKNELEVA